MFYTFGDLFWGSIGWFCGIVAPFREFYPLSVQPKSPAVNAGHSSSWYIDIANKPTDGK
jgi:hypothetical protein